MFCLLGRCLLYTLYIQLGEIIIVSRGDEFRDNLLTDPLTKNSSGTCSVILSCSSGYVPFWFWRFGHRHLSTYWVLNDFYIETLHLLIQNLTYKKS